MPKQKQKKQVTPTSEWKKPQGEPLELPSGKVCLCRVVGPQAFLTSGAIPNALMPLIRKALEKAEKGKEPSKAELDQIIEDVAKDPAKLQEVFDMADAITVRAVIEPHVTPIPPDAEDGSPAERDPDLLYVDEVDMEDKFFILSFAMGGTRDLERFRGELESGVDALVQEQSVASDAGNPAGVQ